jgi:hypothetical protein
MRSGVFLLLKCNLASLLLPYLYVPWSAAAHQLWVVLYK